MATITTRPYRKESDLETIVELINTCDRVHNLDNGTSVSELKIDLTLPSVDQERDIGLWEDSNGKLIGFGSLHITEPSDVIDGYLSIYIHPELNSDNLASRIIQWSEERMNQVRQERGFEVKLRSGCRDNFCDRIKTFENNGFTIARYFFTMERSLLEQIPEPQFPEGFTLRKINPEKDASQWVELFNQAFQDHWNHHNLTVENLQHWQNHENYRADLDLIVVASDGQFAACCFAGISPEDNIRNQCQDGWIDVLATQQKFRRMGLGKALLLSNLHQLKANCMENVKLGVDADNPNGALGLYESLGFYRKYTTISYVKDVKKQ